MFMIETVTHIFKVDSKGLANPLEVGARAREDWDGAATLWDGGTSG